MSTVNRYSLFSRDCPVGSNVNITLVDGVIITGTLLEKNDEYQSIRVKDEYGEDTFFGDEIRRWRILSSHTIAQPAVIDTPLEPIINTLPVVIEESQIAMEIPKTIIAEEAQDDFSKNKQKIEIERQFNEIKQLAIMAFGGKNELVPLPEPVFILPENIINNKIMSKNDIEIVRNKSKSKFDNAIKQHDVAKIREILQEVKDVENRYISYRIPVLPQLCALLLLRIDSVTNKATAYDYLKKALDWEQNNVVSLRGFIYVTIQQEKWKEAGESLMRLLLVKDTIEQCDESFVKALGRCLLNLQEDTLPGLMSLKNNIQLQSDYFKYLLFLALAKESQEAAILAYQKKYAEAQKMLPNSVTFQSAAMLYKPELEFDRLRDLENQKNISTELTGTVIFYPDRQFGFINNTIRNESFCFSHNDIVDSDLRTALINGITLQIRDIKVAFEDTGYRPWNKTWNIAKNVRFASNTEKERVMKQVKVKSSKKETSLDIRLSSIPIGNSPYVAAKRFELLGDLDAAEHEYTKVLALGKRNRSGKETSTVLDLAAIYNRQGRTDEALQIIDDNQKIYFNVSDTDRLDNVRISILTKAKRFREAANLLQRKIEVTREIPENIAKLATWLQQKAFCYQMMAFEQRKESILTDTLPTIIEKLQKLRYYRNIGKQESLRVQSSLELVQKMPDKLTELLNPQNTEQANEEIQESVATSFISEIDEIRLPIVAKNLLDTCQFENVEQRVKELLNSDTASNNITDLRKEIGRLLEQLDTRGKRPLVKAALRLNIAAIYYRVRSLCNEDEIENNIYLSLSFLGENQVYEKDREMARIYLSTALSIPADYKIDFAFAMLIITYLTNLPDTNDIIVKQGTESFLEYAINLLDQEVDACHTFTQDFPFYVNKFYEKCKTFLNEVRKKQRRNINQILSTNIDLWRKEEQIRLQDEDVQFRSLETTTYPTVNLLSERFAGLRKIAQRSVFQIDRQRLDRLAEIAERLSEIDRQKDYFAKDKQISEIETAIQTLDNDIQLKPSSLSLQHIKLLCEKIQQKVGELKKKNIEDAEPKITVINPLQEDNYVLEENRIRLHIKVQLQRGTAPIQSLEVKIISSDGIDYDHETGMSPEMLRDGDSRNLQVDIIPSQELIAKKAFDVQLTIGYTPINSFEPKETEIYTFPVRIGTPDKPIVNPYDIAGRSPVSDPKKFVGRTDTINEIVRQMTDEPLGKCYVLFGQMRSGKSSTLKQIQGKFTSPCLAVYTDASAAENEGSQNINFSLMVRDSLRKALAKELTGNEKDLDLFREFNDLFKDIAMFNAPVPTFSSMMDYASERLCQHGWNNPRIVLLIDEFTYIYDNICAGKIDGSTMRHWKAMLQTASFSAVLVGQDTMPWFLEKFPNEFGVIEKKRISYLSKDETQQMADGWIYDNGKSRYRDTAFNRLFELTGGNPFYTQRFCYTLVEYLNSRKASVITEADVDNTCSLLCRGGENFDKIDSSEFHPLYLPLNKQRFKEEQYIGILRQIAVQTKQYGQATIDDIMIDGLIQDDVNYIINELVKREILEQLSETNDVKIRVNIYTEYLCANR
ncbi:MAG: tetratricopeptide repeat protein [Planctomycetaceae bacterium]|jgi:hypothetical protein|nr:tetratricopeptide repeat protein [Planctomycetaceae bacterium]